MSGRVAAGSPGAGGYLLAWAVSVAVLDLVVCAPAWDQPLGLFVMLAVVGVYAAVLGAPAAVVGILAVHLLTRRVRAQWVHVVLAGLAGVAAGAAYSALLFGGDFSYLPWAVGVATAVGRAAVVPLARRRAPVDDDFAGAVAR